MKWKAIPYSAVHLHNASLFIFIHLYSEFLITVQLFIFTVPFKVIACVRFIVQSTGWLIS